MTAHDGVVTIWQSHRVAKITLDRPAAKNAVTSTMFDQLTAIVDKLATDDTVEVVVICGAGTDFCAGSDLGDLASVLSATSAQREAAFRRGIETAIQPLARSLLRLPQPVVASARGHAIGLGVLFLLAADLVILSETAKISVPQVRLGHTLDHGESWLLPRRVGPAKAMQLSLLGERMTASAAQQCGLANWLTADEALEARTDEVVAGLLAVAPIPLARTKALLRASMTNDFEQQLAMETTNASQCAGTADFIEAITAQVERRAPQFTRS